MLQKKEVVRRYFNELCNYKQGISDLETVQKIKILMNELNIDENFLKVVEVSKKTSEKKKTNVIALELPKGKIITGKQTELLSAASSVVINAIKELSKMPDEINLLSPTILEPILKLRKNNSPLSLQEVLIALAVCSVTNPSISSALEKLDMLKECEAHATYIVTNGDLKALKSLKINLTCEPNFYSKEIM